MFISEPEKVYPALSYSYELILALVITLGFTLGIGIYPAPWIELAKSSVLVLP